MTLLSRFWHAVVRITAWLTFSSVPDWGVDPAQHPLGNQLDYDNSLVLDGNGLDDCPIWKPPTGDPEDTFTCDYSYMKDWCPCSIPENRECWLRHKYNGSEFNIHTNYEDVTPTGIVRDYTLRITESWYNADGRNFTNAKLFNNSYPGPWIQACWGDVST